MKTICIYVDRFLYVSIFPPCENSLSHRRQTCAILTPIGLECETGDPQVKVCHRVTHNHVSFSNCAHKRCDHNEVFTEINKIKMAKFRI